MNDAGLQCYINRYTDGKCCEWCNKIAGRYDYATAPQDVFRRHDNCGCKAIYECGNTRQDIWSKQSWTTVDAEASDKAVNYTPPKLSPEQANAIEQEKLSQFKPLTVENNVKTIDISAESDIMKESIVIGRSIGAAGKNYPVKLPDGNHAKFAEGTEITKIKVFAGKGTDTPIRNAKLLEATYRIAAEEWQKLRGEGVIVYKKKNHIAEVHWYEVRGNRVEFKVKRWLDEG